ncbi:MAG TPA: hypothetical protein VHB79_01155 [Polyangiaceae bacterium]|nr:hypothetical protein [Polyangiaceae bacterium]
MDEFFNPAGLDVAEDRRGAIAYGFIAPRVFYARFVGELSLALGEHYVTRLRSLFDAVPSLVYFADTSALAGYDCGARTRFLRFVLDQRAKFSSLVLLSSRAGITPAARGFAATVGEPVTLLDDPNEFDRLLSNVVPIADPALPAFVRVERTSLAAAERGGISAR